MSEPLDDAKLLVMPGWVKVLNTIYCQADITPKISISRVSKLSGVNYPWACQIIHTLEKNKVLRTRKSGRQILIYLTPYGQEAGRAANFLENVARKKSRNQAESGCEESGEGGAQ